MKHLKKSKGTTTKCNEHKGWEIPFLVSCFVLADIPAALFPFLTPCFIFHFIPAFIPPCRHIRTGKGHFSVFSLWSPWQKSGPGELSSAVAPGFSYSPLFLHWVVPGTLFPLSSQIISQWCWGINTAIQKRISLLMAAFFQTLILRQFSASGISRQCNLKHFKITFPHRSWESPGSS